jgi:hypothetical protein
LLLLTLTQQSRETQQEQQQAALTITLALALDCIVLRFKVNPVRSRSLKERSNITDTSYIITMISSIRSCSSPRGTSNSKFKFKLPLRDIDVTTAALLAQQYGSTVIQATPAILTSMLIKSLLVVVVRGGIQAHSKVHTLLDPTHKD